MSSNVIIGAWYVTPDQNKLSLNAKDYVIEPLAMAVLVYFAKNPSKVISLEELVDHVWKGRVVGDHAIYRIINQIRKILGEDTDVCYITTIRKKGYQLNPQVKWVDSVAPEGDKHLDPPNVRPNKSRTFSPKPWLIIVAAPLVALGIWFVASYLIQSMNYDAIKTFNVVKPFSVLIGKEKDASYSPNGQFISYSHLPMSGQHFKIYIQSVDGKSPRQITTELGDDFSASWSPDSSELVFVRHVEGACNIMRISIKENSTTPLTVVACNTSGLANEVVWGPSGNIYYTDSLSAVDPYKIYKYSLKTSKKEQLTNPVSGNSKGDIHIALAHNGSQLAFTRDKNWGATQVKLLDLKTQQMTDLFSLSGWRKALAWSFDDQNLYYIDKDDNINAYSIRYSFHKKVLENSDTLHSISSHKTEDKLAIMTGETGIDIWGKRLGIEEPESAFIESSEIDLYPEFANNSSDIAFMSLRSGHPQIWIKENNGKEYQLSKFSDRRVVQRIRWSPNDQYVLASTNNELYTIDVETKEYKTIWRSAHPSRVEAASWAPDGNSVYFSSDIDGDWQIYKKNLAANTQTVKVTERGGYSPELTNSGDMLYYKYHQDGIWKMQLDSGSEVKLVDDSNIYAYDALYARNNGFFYVAVSDTENVLNFYDLKTGEVTPIQVIVNPLIDYTVSEDGTLILYPKLLNEETEIKVLEKTSDRLVNGR